MRTVHSVEMLQMTVAYYWYATIEANSPEW